MSVNRYFDYIPFLDGQKAPSFVFRSDSLDYTVSKDAPRFLVPIGLGPFIELKVSHHTKVIPPRSDSGWGYSLHQQEYKLPMKHEIILNTEKLANYLIDRMSIPSFSSSNSNTTMTQLGEIFQSLLKMKQQKSWILKSSDDTRGTHQHEMSVPFKLGLFSLSPTTSRLLHQLLLDHDAYKTYGAFGPNKFDNVHTCSSCVARSFSGLENDYSDILDRQLIIQPQDITEIIYSYACGRNDEISREFSDKHYSYLNGEVLQTLEFQHYICIPMDMIYIPLGCSSCEFIGNLRYTLDVRRSKKLLMVDLNPFKNNDADIIPSINEAITKDVYWSRQDLKFEYSRTISNPHNFMRRAAVYHLTAKIGNSIDNSIDNSIVVEYSAPSFWMILTSLAEVFIQYRIDLTIPLSYGRKTRKIQMSLPPSFFCTTRTCLGIHKEIDAPCKF